MIFLFFADISQRRRVVSEQEKRRKELRHDQDGVNCHNW
jgi:hypothetical protein